jgi:hypothetical protein
MINIIGKYPTQSIFSLSLLRSMLIQAFFKHEVMINEIDELLRMEGGKNKPSYQKLLYNPFWELSDEEFQIALADTFNTAKNGDLHHVCYFRGFVTFYQFR